MYANFQTMRTASAAAEPDACKVIAAAMSSKTIQKGVSYLCTGEATRHFGSLYFEDGAIKRACGEEAFKRFKSSSSSIAQGPSSLSNEYCAAEAYKYACALDGRKAPDPTDCFCALNTYCAERGGTR